MLCKTYVFLCVIGVIYAALSIGIPEKNPYNYEEGCFIQEFNHSIPFGKTVVSKTRCIEYRCGKHEIVLASCGSVHYPQECTFIRYKDKPYPNCCMGRIQCPEKNEVTLQTEQSTEKIN